MKDWESKEKLSEGSTLEKTKEAFSVLSWVYNNMDRKHHLTIFIITIFSSVHNIVLLYIAYLSKELINSAISKDSITFRNNAVILIVTIIVGFIYDYLYDYYCYKRKNEMLIDMRKHFYQTIVKKQYSVIDSIRIGDLYNRLNQDIPEIFNTLISMPGVILTLLIQILGSCYLIYQYAPEAGMIAIPLTILIAYYTYLVSKKMSKYHERLWKENSTVSSLLFEHLSNLQIFRAYGKEDYSYKQVAKAIDDNYKTDKTIKQMSVKYTSVSDFFNLAISTLSMFYFINRMIFHNLSFGAYTMIMSLVARIQSKINDLSEVIPTLYKMVLAARRIKEIDSIQDDLSEETIDDNGIREFYNNEFESIAMKDISFSYSEDDRRLVLEGFNAQIDKNQCVAVTGISGAGKSTLLKLLLAMYQCDNGEIYFKTHDGKVLLDSKYRGLFSYVPQNNTILFGTIRQAITFDETKKDNDEDCFNALKVACAEEFVRLLPDGLDTVIGENGVGLSQGQIQRIAIARAVYSNRPVMLLDECTSSLDQETEKKVLINLKSLNDKTIIIVTHHPEVLEYCDREIKMYPIERNVNI